MLKRITLAVALAIAPLAAGSLSGCASVQDVQPETPRQALAEVEIALIGAASVTEMALRSGHLSTAEALGVYERLEYVGQQIDVIRRLIQVTDADGASAKLAEVRALLSEVSLELSTRAEQVRQSR
jgi:hypothetical protein